MHGPQPAGFWSSHQAANCGSKHQFLIAGHQYSVVREFLDYDKHRHPAGEEWQFCGFCFLPYEDGMSFFVSFDGQQEWNIPLQWRAEEQGQILDRLAEYIQPL